jgi:uncharacterized RDD family membrane protein YckC
MKTVRWRRLAAGLIDFAPLTVALLLVMPLLMAVSLNVFESLLGVGIYDPAIGGDPVLLMHLGWRRPLALAVLIGALVWVALELLALARQRGSIGQIFCGIAVQRQDGQPASLRRQLVRGSLRQALVLALLATAAVAARPDPAVAMREGRLALGLAGALALVLAIDLVLALAGARGLGDRLAGTSLRRR